MLAFMRKLQEAQRRDEGASAVEYGLLVAAIAALVVVVLFAFGGMVRGVFDNTCDTIAGSTEPEGDECDTGEAPAVP